MGNLVTRDGLHRHAYAAMLQPSWVTEHAVSASVQDGAGGPTLYPISAPLATFAADGAPYYVYGWQPGEAAQLPGGQIPLSLPPVAAQIDLSDRQSWDRPVFWPGSV